MIKKGKFNLIYYKYIIDFLSIIFSYFFSLFLVFGKVSLPFNPFFLTLIILIWFVISSFSNLYSDRRSNKFSEEIVFIFYHILLFTIALSSSLFFIQMNISNSFHVLIYLNSSLFILSTISKYIIRKKTHAAFYQGKQYDSVLIIGSTNSAKNFIEALEKHYYYGYKCIGYIDDNNSDINKYRKLGEIKDLIEVLQNNIIDEVVIALPNDKYDTIQRCIDICDSKRTKVRILPDFRQYATTSVYINTIGKVPVMNVGGLPLDRWEIKLLKRSFDIIFSLVFFFTIGLILFPLISLLIKITSKGPVFFKQERWGLNNKLIICYKFRTMIQESKDVDEDGKYQQAQKDDPRITSIGRILRKTNLDEIPQFWNVLIGNMSVVGPRPHPTPLNKESMHTVDNYMLRHIVLPGITGWAQVNGCRGETKTVEEMQERVDFDLSYIHRWTFWLDCQIILQTIINLIRGDQNAY